MTQFIAESQVDPRDLSELMMKIDEVCDGHPRTHVLVSLLSVLLYTFNPEITPEEVAEGIKEVSKFIVSRMADSPSSQIIHLNETSTIDKLKMN